MSDEEIGVAVGYFKILIRDGVLWLENTDTGELMECRNPDTLLRLKDYLADFWEDNF